MQVGMSIHEDMVGRALSIAADHSRDGANGPFGAVIVCNGLEVAVGWNHVVEFHDPTAHAEICAIREACRIMKTHDLSDCILYSSCEPCPMCLSAIYWARIPEVYYGATRGDAQLAGFDDEWIYDELAKPDENKSIIVRRVIHPEASSPFDSWIRNPQRKKY